MTEAEFAALVPNRRDIEYGPGYFKFAEMDHAWANVLFGNILWLLFNPRSVIDLGCGTGGVLAALYRHGVDVIGVDGSPDAIPFIGRNEPALAERVIVQNLAEPWTAPRRFDVAVCIEALEHIPPHGADAAVAAICSAAPVAVISTPPPSGGRNALHVNEQPFAVWQEKFAKHGMTIDQGTTDALRTIMRGFGNMYRAQRYPVIPCWFYSSYFAVFALGGAAATRRP